MLENISLQSRNSTSKLLHLIVPQTNIPLIQVFAANDMFIDAKAPSTENISLNMWLGENTKDK